MNTDKLNPLKRSIIAVGAALAFGWAAAAQAHCDTLDGPVVEAGRRALDTGNPNLALIWVQKGDEAKSAMHSKHASTVRKAGGEAKVLADRYFFETLVRVHRAGEGAPFTGLKPAGKPEPAICRGRQGDRDRKARTGGQPRFGTRAQRAEQGSSTMCVEEEIQPERRGGGRAYVRAYVEYVHYVERLHDAAGNPGARGSAIEAARACPLGECEVELGLRTHAPVSERPHVVARTGFAAMGGVGSRWMRLNAADGSSRYRFWHRWNFQASPIV